MERTVIVGRFVYHLAVFLLEAVLRDEIPVRGHSQ